jgi:hypothetical protein
LRVHEQGGWLGNQGLTLLYPSFLALIYDELL